MLVEIYDAVSRKYKHLDGYLLLAEMRDAVAVMDKHFPNLKIDVSNSIMYGQFDYNNEFTRELMGCLSRLDKDDSDRVRTFCEIFVENYKGGVSGAFNASFAHFNKIVYKHASIVERTKLQRNASVFAKGRPFTP